LHSARLSCHAATKMKPVSSLGLLVGAARRLLGWSQKDLAARPGAPRRPELSRLESGQNQGTSKALRAGICSAFGVSSAVLESQVAGLDETRRRDAMGALLTIASAEVPDHRATVEYAIGLLRTSSDETIANLRGARVEAVDVSESSKEVVVNRFKAGRRASNLDVAIVYSPERWSDETVAMALMTTHPNQRKPQEWADVLDHIEREIAPRLREALYGAQRELDLPGVSVDPTPQPQPSQRPKRPRRR
jgi:transcriptional regulator with XRE-family HTH domain